MTESKIKNEGLGRFLTAQDGKRGDYTLYELALKEIKEGKLGFECWIRYVYPQLKRKGTSQLTDLLIEITEAVLNSKYSAYEIFGDDIIKFRSNILLFDSVSDIPVFRQIKNKYRW